MASQRKIIRAAIVTALKNAALSGVGNNVFPNRWTPIWQGELPAVFVYTDTEDAEVFNLAPREMRRETQVITEVIMNVEATLDDQLDDISDAIENAVAADAQFAGTADDTFLKATALELFTGGDSLMGSLKITWDVRWYKRMPSDLSGALPVLGKADLKYDIAPQDGVIDGEDSLTTDALFQSLLSLALDGTKHIAIPSGAGQRKTPVFALGTAATWSGWVKPTAATLGVPRSLFACFDLGSPKVGFEVGIGLVTPGKLGLYTGSGVGAAATEDTGASIATGAWTHVAVTFDGVNVRFYQNGTLSSTVARTEAIGIALAPLFLGADTNQPSTRRFIGLITNFAIGNIAMSGAQITELNATGDPTDLRLHSAAAAGNWVGWWQMMGAGDTVNQILDLFGNNHGAAINVLPADLSADVP